MAETDLIALLLTVIAAMVALYIFRRFLIVLGLILLLGVFAYLYFDEAQATEIAPNAHKHSKSVIENVENEFCTVMQEREDTLKCRITKLLARDLMHNFSSEDLEKMKKDEIIDQFEKSLQRNKKIIFSDILVKAKDGHVYKEYAEDLEVLKMQ